MRVTKELKRWFLNNKGLTLNQKINNRGIMYDNHYMILEQPIHKSKLEIGKLKQFSVIQYRNKSNPKHFRENAKNLYIKLTH